MGKLDARKSKQGTSENLGRKISLHGSLFIMQNPPQHIRDAHDHIDSDGSRSNGLECGPGLGRPIDSPRASQSGRKGAK